MKVVMNVCAIFTVTLLCYALMIVYELFVTN